MKNKKKVSSWIILFGIIFILGFITQVAPKLINKVKSTEIVEYGELSVKEDAKAIIIRKEHVYLAPYDIKVNYKVDEGSLMKAKSELLEFSKIESKGSKQEEKEKKVNYKDKLEGVAFDMEDGQTKEKGVFSTYIDGNEKFASIDNIDNINFDDIKDLKEEISDIKNENIKSQEPVYKMIDQSKWYVLTWIDNRKLSRYEEGQNVNIYFKDKQNPLQFKIEKIEDAGKMSKILFSTDRYYSDFAKFRVSNIEIETVSLNGIIVDNKNIIEKGDKSGVYVVSKTGEHIFTEIKILGSDGEKSAVKEDLFYDKEGNMVKTLKVFDEIVVKPKVKKDE